MSHLQWLFQIPILNQINPFSLIDTYFFKFYSNIFLPSASRPSLRYKYNTITTNNTDVTFIAIKHTSKFHDEENYFK